MPLDDHDSYLTLWISYDGHVHLRADERMSEDDIVDTLHRVADDLRRHSRGIDAAEAAYTKTKINGSGT